jgi:UTP--glucose-1-phosphate uridylyltransferase
MDKRDAIYLFGEAHQDAAKALGIGKSAFSQWPNKLTQKQTALVIGRAMILGKRIPDSLLAQCRNS